MKWKIIINDKVVISSVVRKMVCAARIMQVIKNQIACNDAIIFNKRSEAALMPKTQALSEAYLAMLSDLVLSSMSSTSKSG